MIDHACVQCFARRLLAAEAREPYSHPTNEADPFYIALHYAFIKFILVLIFLIILIERRRESMSYLLV